MSQIAAEFFSLDISKDQKFWNAKSNFNFKKTFL
jgi:hypothetical protein